MTVIEIQLLGPHSRLVQRCEETKIAKDEYGGGRTLMPTPKVVKVCDASKICMLLKPAAGNANAAVKPPIPAPAMMILGWVSR